MTSSRLSPSRSPARRRRQPPTVAVGAGRKFYDDDPLGREPETQDASKVAEWDIDLFVDLADEPVRPSRATRRRTCAPEHQHDRRGARLELVHQPHPARGRCRSTRPSRGPLTGDGPAPGPGRSIAAEAGRASRRASRCATAQRRAVVRLVRRDGLPRSGDRRDSGRQQDLLDARLLAGREPPDLASAPTSSSSRRRRRSRRRPGKSGRCG